MKRINSLIIALIVCLSTSYGQLQYRLSATGMQFLIIKDESGASAKVGQLVSMNMSIKDANGNFIKNTFKDAKPLMFPVKHFSFEGDIYEAVTTLSKGDSGVFLLPADSMYKHIFRKEMPTDLKKGTFLEVRIKVFDIFDQEGRIETLQKQADTVLTANEKARRQKEEIAIKQYVESLGYEFKKTPKGVYYTYLSSGKGQSIVTEGNSVIINFTGKLLNGQEFETSYNEEGIGHPVSFVLGKNEVIEGWEESVLGKKEGDRLLCVVPSHLAFGGHAKGNKIPAHSVLVFNLDIMGVR
jgi:FKBP-type peptidyl-prolyl cis-trans isomerase FkpA